MKNERIIEYINNRYNIPLIMEYNYKTKMNNKNIIKRNIYNLHIADYISLFISAAYIVRRTAYIVHCTAYIVYNVHRTT